MEHTDNNLFRSIFNTMASRQIKSNSIDCRPLINKMYGFNYANQTWKSLGMATFPLCDIFIFRYKTLGMVETIC